MEAQEALECVLERKAVFVHWEFGIILKCSETHVLIQFLHQGPCNHLGKIIVQIVLLVLHCYSQIDSVFQSTSTVPQPTHGMKTEKWRKTKIITAAIKSNT